MFKCVCFTTCGIVENSRINLGKDSQVSPHPHRALSMFHIHLNLGTELLSCADVSTFSIFLTICVCFFLKDFLYCPIYLTSILCVCLLFIFVRVCFTIRGPCLLRHWIPTKKTSQNEHLQRAFWGIHMGPCFSQTSPLQKWAYNPCCTKAGRWNYKATPPNCLSIPFNSFPRFLFRPKQPPVAVAQIWWRLALLGQTLEDKLEISGGLGLNGWWFSWQ